MERGRFNTGTTFHQEEKALMTIKLQYLPILIGILFSSGCGGGGGGGQERYAHEGWMWDIERFLILQVFSPRGIFLLMIGLPIFWHVNIAIGKWRKQNGLDNLPRL